jgi:dephospho-CoA kinase
LARKKLLLITGMSGAGKTTLAGFFEGIGFRIITMGDVIRGLAEERGLEPSPENLGALAKEIRRVGGESAVAERCVEKLRRMEGDDFVVDGIRSVVEVGVFRASFDAVLIAVHASQETRFRRLRRRGRTDDPADMETFKERDQRELGFGLGRAIALADYKIVNEGAIEDFERSFEGLIEQMGLA